MLDRMVKSARLDQDTFLDLKADSSATNQALIVLVLAGASFGVGFASLIGYRAAVPLLLGAAFGAIFSIVLGFVWLSLTFLVGTRIFHGTSDYWSLARPVFFATSPGLVFLIMLIPVSIVPDSARAVGVAWIAISTVFAIRAALGLDSQRSLLTFILVALIVLIGYGLVSSV
jgi:hypothetical protein